LIVASTIAKTLSTATLLAVADPASTDSHLADLMDRGFEVVAEGQLVRTTECNRYTMQVLPYGSSDSCKTLYGSFKRLKNGDKEFVCVSFPDWSCHQSQTLN